MGRGRGWGCGGLVWESDVTGREGGRRKNMLFGGPRVVYIHYFKGIYQGALQLVKLIIINYLPSTGECI